MAYLIFVPMAGIMMAEVFLAIVSVDATELCIGVDCSPVNTLRATGVGVTSLEKRGALPGLPCC